MFGILPPMPLILEEGVLKEHANISFIPKLGSLDSDAAAKKGRPIPTDVLCAGIEPEWFIVGPREVADDGLEHLSRRLLPCIGRRCHQEQKEEGRGPHASVRPTTSSASR